MEILTKEIDKRSNCISILSVMTLKEYHDLAYSSFKGKGNIDGQRSVIKRSAIASKIRKRMHDDFAQGAIFPQVVVGVLLSENEFNAVKADEDIVPLIINEKNDVSIIDGMQRSNIYFSNYEGNEERKIRVEFWVADNPVKMLYRMLVLNTGQVPWNTRRQIEVVFDGLLRRIEDYFEGKSLKPEFMGVDDANRRTQPGKYHKSTLVELYLAFNIRSVRVDVSEELADEFQRFDMLESIEKEVNFEFFMRTFVCLYNLDLAFAYCGKDVENGQFKTGRDIFGSGPVCLGFVVACAEYVLGKVSFERNEQEKKEKMCKLEQQIENIVKIMSHREDDDFLALNVLNGVVSGLGKNKIGEEMRITFKHIFADFLRLDDTSSLHSMEALWRC